MEQNETKICPNCGKEIKSEAKKCRFCGTWLEEAETKTQESEIKPPETDDKNGDMAKLLRYHRTIVILLAISMAVLISMPAIFLLFSSLYFF